MNNHEYGYKLTKKKKYATTKLYLFQPCFAERKEKTLLEPNASSQNEMSG
jgi:hypothetical protein